MRLSLKKFTEDPYKNIKHAPLILEVSGRPRYAIIPYSLYKELRDKTNTNLLAPAEPIRTTTHKRWIPDRILKLLFE